jgi:DNA-binding NarL/FixJ family response regulator
MDHGHILIADDEPTFLQATAELLRKHGYECTCASDGSTAAELVRETHFDLVIADIKMPGNTELELVRELSRLSESLPVILVTGYPSLDTAIGSVELPVVAYLVKPIDFSDLLEQVRFSLSESLPARVQELEQGLARISDDLNRLTGRPASHSAGQRSLHELEVLNGISKREWEVLECLLERRGVPGIAEALNISPHTVRNHIKSILRKSGVRSQSELMAKIVGEIQHEA